MSRPYKLTRLIEQWLDNRCPWIHTNISMYYSTYSVIHGIDYGIDVIYVQGYDDIYVLDNKWVEVQPSYMVDIRDPDFFKKLAKRLGLSREIRQMDRLLYEDA